MLRRLIQGIQDGRRARRVEGLVARGINAERQNDLPAALGHYHAAVVLAPVDGNVLCLLGNALRRSGCRQDAIDVLRRAIAAAPDLREAYFLLASVLPLPDGRAELVRTLRRALALGDDSAKLKLNFRLGQALRDAHEHDGAIQHFAQALEVHGDSRDLDIHAQLANLLHARGRADEARHHYGRAWEVNRDDAMRLKRVTILPPVPRSREDIVRVRSQLVEEVHSLLALDLRLDEPEKDIGHTDFFLAYHGLDDRPIKELLAGMYLHAYPSLRFASPHLAEIAARHEGKLRIGIVSAYLLEHTIGRLMLEFFRHVRRDRFHVTAFVFAPAQDTIARDIHRLCDKVVFLAPALDAARASVAAEKVDLLLYCDIGMEPFTYFMAFARLAPVQCVTWGHPVTTGLPEMDYFVSSALVEPEGAANHYSEKLACLPASCAFACYGRPVVPADTDRARFGFAPDANIYLCSQTLFKLHPDFDAMIGNILRRDPAGLLVFISQPAHLQPQIAARWAPLFDDVMPRIRFLPFCAHDEFLSLLRAADVILDPPHFGGGNSALEAMAMGTPVVTMPGAFARSRFTYANYLRMGVLDCVAKNAGEYVDIAVRLGTDRPHRERVKARIAEASHLLYADVGAVRALERFFSEAIERARNHNDS